MVEVPHTIVGAAIAYKIGNPALALPLAFASHFVLDAALPHWDPSLRREKNEFGRVSTKTTLIIAVDTLTSLIVGFAIASLALPDLGRFITVVLGSFFAVLPDVIEAPYFFLNWQNPTLIRFLQWHSSIQTRIPLVPGILTQVLVMAASVWWIFS